MTFLSNKLNKVLRKTLLLTKLGMFWPKSKKCTMGKWTKSLWRSFPPRMRRQLTHRIRRCSRWRNLRSHQLLLTPSWSPSVFLIASFRTFLIRKILLFFRLRRTSSKGQSREQKCSSQWRRWRCLLLSWKIYSMHSISELYTWDLPSLSTLSWALILDLTGLQSPPLWGPKETRRVEHMTSSKLRLVTQCLLK